METYQKVAELLAERKGMQASDIKPESTFADLALDSLDVAEAVMDLEDTFSVSIEITQNMVSVADLVRAIDEARS